MASYDKLPSGRWRGRAMVDGKRITVTAETKRECVAEIERRLRVRRGEMTVGQAVDEYIDSHAAVFSPSTVKAYRSMARYRFDMLRGIALADLTEADVARAVNREAATCSPKTVRNAWGLLHSAIAPFVPVSDWRIRLPQKIKKEPYIPSEEEVTTLIEKANGTPYELPFKLAAYCGLRRSEICALTGDDVRDGFIIIDKAVVLGEDNALHTKAPKTYSGYRRIKVPKNVKINAEKGIPLTTLSPIAISQACRRLSGGKFSIHDLRHFYASMLLRLGVPNKYAAKQMGHATENMLQKVYQHLFPDAEAEYDELISERLGKM